MMTVEPLRSFKWWSSRLFDALRDERHEMRYYLQQGYYFTQMCLASPCFEFGFDVTKQLFL